MTTQNSIEVIQAVSFKTGKCKSLGVSYEAWLVSGGSPLVLMPVLKAAGLSFKIVEITALGEYRIYAYDLEATIKKVKTYTPINDFVTLSVDSKGDFTCDNAKISRKVAAKVGSKVYQSLMGLPLLMMQEVGLMAEDDALIVATLSAAISNILGVENSKLMDKEERDNLAAAMVSVASEVSTLRYETPKKWLSYLEDSRLSELRLERYLETEERKALAASNDTF